MTPKQIADKTEKQTIEALERAQAILKENGVGDPNSFLVVEVAKLYTSVRAQIVEGRK